MLRQAHFTSLTRRTLLTLGSHCEQCLNFNVQGAAASGVTTLMRHLMGNVQIAMVGFVCTETQTSHCQNVRNERGLKHLQWLVQVLHHPHPHVSNNAHMSPRSPRLYVGLLVTCQSSTRAPVNVEHMLQNCLALLPTLVRSDQHTCEPVRCSKVNLLSQLSDV